MYELVDVFFSVTTITTFREMVGFVLPATERVAEFEGPQEVVAFFEVGTNGVDFVNEIFHADYIVLAQRSVDDVVVGQGDSLLVNFTMTTFVQQFRHSLEGRGTISDIGFNAAEHSHSGMVNSEEDTVVELTKTKKLENFFRFGVHSHDTSDTYNEDHFSFRVDIEVAVVLGLALHADSGTFTVTVLLDVFFSSFELFLADTFLCLADRSGSGIASGFDFSGSLALFEEGLGSRNRTKKIVNRLNKQLCKQCTT